MKKIILIVFGLFFLLIIANKVVKNVNLNTSFEIGQKIDSLNNIIVYYNGGVGNVEERNTIDGYNVGLKYQCVEFVKRYYYKHLNHKMPDSYGHAFSFFDTKIKDGELNKQRNLHQYRNPSVSKPKINDLIVFDKTVLNLYGHVAIISNVSEDEIEIIQQNPGPFSPSRIELDLHQNNDKTWEINNDRVLGWLRKN